MTYQAGHAEGEEEEGLHKYFDKAKFTVGGDTAQLQQACDAVQQFIAQELCGDTTNTPTFADLWSYFPNVLMRIFGRQDATPGGGAGGGGGITGVYAGGFDENSWIFAATSFHALNRSLRSHQKLLSAGEGRGGVPRGGGGSGGGTTGDVRLCCMPTPALPLLSLLFAKPTDFTSSTTKNLFGVLLEPREVWYTFSCASPPLPPHTLDALRHEVAPNPVLFENARLYTHCLQKPPRPRQVVGFRNTPEGVQGVDDGMAVEENATPDLHLSMLEFYLFSFAWYALSSSGDFYAGHDGPGRVAPHRHHTGVGGISYRPERVAAGWRSYGVKGLTHSNPYMALLKDYVEYFFPHSAAAVRGGTGDIFRGMTMQDEMFLRVLIEFWLEGNSVLRPGVRKQEDESAIQHHLHHQQQQHLQHHWAGNRSAMARPAVPPPQLQAAPAPAAPQFTASYDPSSVVLNNDFTTPTDVSLHGLLLASAHLLADPRLAEACRRRIHAAAVASSSAGDWRGGSALTPALEVLRPHVFGFLRVMFSPESKMDTSSATFSLAVELWLLWLRPWAAPAIAKGRSPEPPRHKHASAAGGGAQGSGEGAAGGVSPTVGGSGGGGRTGMVDECAPCLELVDGVLDEDPHNNNNNNITNNNNTNNANSREGFMRAATGSGGGTSRRGEEVLLAESLGGLGEGRGGRPTYSYDPWGAWVLDNYSFYTTLLAAFTRTASNMSFKVQRDDGSGGGGSPGARGGWAGDVFAQVGRTNVRLLWRLAEAFSGDLPELIAMAENTVRQARQQHGGGMGGRAGALREGEEAVLDEGRKALSAIQGQHLVTLEGYRESAEEVLGAINELTYRAPPRGLLRFWRVKKVWDFVTQAEPDEVTGFAQEISSTFKVLFGLPRSWKPTGHEMQEVSGWRATKFTAIFQPEREKDAPAYLSRQGQAQIASGRRACKPWDVTYVGDPMYHPRRSFETDWSIRFWVAASEKFNERWLGWPSPEDADDEVSSAPFEDERPSRAITMGKEYQRRVWVEGLWARLPRRLNLRLLSDLRVSLGLLAALWLLILACSINTTFAATVATVIIAVVFRVSLMDVYPL